MWSVVTSPVGELRLVIRETQGAFAITAQIDGKQHILRELGGFFDDIVGKFARIVSFWVELAEHIVVQQLVHHEADFPQGGLVHQAAPGAPARAGTMLAERKSTKLRTAGSAARSLGLTAIS